jgi:hypothetical protein
LEPALKAVRDGNGPTIAACEFSSLHGIHRKPRSAKVTASALCLVVTTLSRRSADSLAIQLKLNEIVAALQGASNRLISAEQLSETDLEALQKHYATLSKLAESDSKLTESHSVEEATWRHKAKSRKPNPGKGAA